jgi:predicted 2-oxoglutarate/Fe(II)-dependent dioxygenase YbiX
MAECRALIDEYASASEWSPAEVVAGHHPEKRNCEAVAVLSPGVSSLITSRRERAGEIVECLKRLGDSYAKHHPECVVTKVVGAQLLRYRPGGFYVQHHDASFELPRILTCVVGLNDDFVGGSLAFFDGAARIRLGCGRSVVFPSNFLFPHAAEPVLTGVRYALVAWLA